VYVQKLDDGETESLAYCLRAEDLDLLGPARLTLHRDGLGEMSFIAVEVGLDYRVVERDRQSAIAFSFDGSDEGDHISGRGWAVLESDALHGRVFIHHGDESSFVARRASNVGASRPAGRRR
jgi:hypothetical protein